MTPVQETLVKCIQSALRLDGQLGAIVAPSTTDMVTALYQTLDHTPEILQVNLDYFRNTDNTPEAIKANLRPLFGYLNCQFGANLFPYSRTPNAQEYWETSVGLSDEVSVDEMQSPVASVRAFNSLASAYEAIDTLLDAGVEAPRADAIEMLTDAIAHLTAALGQYERNE